MVACQGCVGFSCGVEWGGVVVVVGGLRMGGCFAGERGRGTWNSIWHRSGDQLSRKAAAT